MNEKPAKPRALELLLSPVNNTQLANLCGALDENLRQIETALDVTIARRGERFTLRGERAKTMQASEALQMFYARAKDGLSIDEIQLGLIEIANRPSHRRMALPGEAPVLMAEPPLKRTKRDPRGAGAAANPVGDPLFDALRATRRELAQEAGVPPYVIFHDAVLRAMANERPTNRTALSAIPGVGAKKLDAWGDAFLAVIDQY